MGGDLESCDRNPARGRRLLERHLVELQQCYRLALAFRQLVNRLSQSAIITRDFRKVRFASGKGFMLGCKRRFAPAQATLPAQPVDDATMRDGDEPRSEGSARIIGMADRVHRQQDVLNCVLHIRWISVMPCDQGAQISSDLVKEFSIGGLIAVLGPGHPPPPPPPLPPLPP